MEIVKILGVDPSVRATGLAVVIYNTESEVYKVERCRTLTVPQKYKGKEAIMTMIDLMNEVAPEYEDVDQVIVESPAAIFNPKFPSSTIAALGHISGAALALFNIRRAYLMRPVEWNRRRKKEKTHEEAIKVLGNPDDWGYSKRMKSEKLLEHILDAASMSLYWIKENYLYEEME